MPSTGNWANYTGLVTSWTLEENPQPPLYWIYTVSNYVLNVCPHTHRKVLLSLLIKETSLCDRDYSRKSQPIKMQSCEAYANIFCTSVSGIIAEEGTERLGEPEDQEVCCEIVSSRNVSKATYMKPQQHDCLNMAWRRMMPKDRSMWKESPQDPQP